VALFDHSSFAGRDTHGAQRIVVSTLQTLLLGQMSSRLPYLEEQLAELFRSRSADRFGRRGSLETNTAQRAILIPGRYSSTKGFACHPDAEIKDNNKALDNGVCTWLRCNSTRYPRFCLISVVRSRWVDRAQIRHHVYVGNPWPMGKDRLCQSRYLQPRHLRRRF